MLLMFLESVWTYNKCMVFVFDLHWLDRALLTSVFLLLEDCTGLSHVTRRDLGWVIQLWNRVVWQKPLWEFNLGTPLCCRSTPEGFHLNFGLAGLRQVSIPTTEVRFAKEVLHMFLGVDWIWFGGSPLDFCWCMFSKFDFSLLHLTRLPGMRIFWWWRWRWWWWWDWLNSPTFLAFKGTSNERYNILYGFGSSLCQRIPMSKKCSRGSMWVWAVTHTYIYIYVFLDIYI